MSIFVDKLALFMFNISNFKIRPFQQYFFRCFIVKTSRSGRFFSPEEISWGQSFRVYQGGAYYMKISTKTLARFSRIKPAFGTHKIED